MADFIVYHNIFSELCMLDLRLRAILGDLAGARVTLDTLRRLLPDAGDSGMAALAITWNEGFIAYCAGDGAAALPLLHTMPPPLRERGNRQMLALVNADLIEVMLETGHLDGIDALLAESQALTAAGIGMTPATCWARTARLAAQRADLPAAESALAQAQATLPAHPTLPERYQLAHARAALAHATHDESGTHTAFAAALAAAEQMGHQPAQVYTQRVGMAAFKLFGPG